MILESKEAITYQEGLRVLLRRALVVELSSLNDLAIDRKLLMSASKNDFFDGALRNETEDSDFLLLSNTMSSILGLQIGVRVLWRGRTADLSALSIHLLP